MTAYKIGRIRIENFKSITMFDEYFEEDMVILDGPNGFGKTTLFDALELVMYGQIKRIEDYKIIDQKQGYRDSLYVKNPRKPVLIQVQFYSESASFVVSKRLPNTSGKKKKASVAANSPTAWERFETYLTSDFVDDFEGLEQVTQTYVHEHLGVAHLMRAFHLFYYIQQEEKTYFLRSTERQRLTVLSDLFGTKKEEIERKQLDDIRKALVKRLTALNNTYIPALEQKIEQKRQVKVNQIEQVFPYTPLLSTEPLPLWDLALESVTDDLRNKSRQELDQIKDFVLHVDTFESARFNKELNAYLENGKLLEHTIILFNHLATDPTEMRKMYQRQNDYTEWLKRLTREKFIHEIETEGALNALISIANEHEWSLNIQEMKELISSIQLKRKSSDALADIVVGINDARKTLQSRNQRFLAEVTGESNGECPMCGEDWGTFEALTQQLERKQQLFEGFYTDASLAISQLADDLFAKHITVIRAGLETYLNKPENIVDAAFYVQWEQSDKSRSLIEAFVGWCSKQTYDLLPYVNQSMIGIEVHQMALLVNNLREFLRSKRLNIDVEYSETSDKFKGFESLLSSRFKNDIHQIKQLSVDMIDQKNAYIESIYYRTNAEEITTLKGNLQSLLNERKRIVTYNENISTIIETYDASIREHWATIISDIEIIFYLYFAKVTQYYQRGLGMFIQQQRESDKDQGMAKALRFVYQTDSDQDAINYLSSGQLSALVVAFTLALNRVYNRGLGVLLIDDPVQTMDDINMASLTELLRNDFKDMQIILSTHEDQVARYLKYKFLKYGLSAERLNMKDKSLGILSSTSIVNE